MGRHVGILFKLQALSITKDQTGYKRFKLSRIHEDCQTDSAVIAPVRLRGARLFLRVQRLRKARLTLRDQLNSETRLTESKA